MKKRAQLSAQIFIYILAIIIVAIIIVLGYKYLSSYQDFVKKSELRLFQNSFSANIESVSSDFGSYKEVSYYFKSLSKLCLIDLTKRDQILQEELINDYPLIKDSVKTNENKNVFAIDDSTFYSFYAGKIEINEYPYFKCFTSKNGKIKFAIEGIGNKVIVASEKNLSYDYQPYDPINDMAQAIDNLNVLDEDLNFNELDNIDPILEDIENI